MAVILIGCESFNWMPIKHRSTVTYHQPIYTSLLRTELFFRKRNIDVQFKNKRVRKPTESVQQQN